MDFNKMSLGARIGLIAGILLFVNLFLPWFAEGDLHINVASSEFAWIISLLGLLAAAILLSGFGIGAFKAEPLTILVGGVATVLALVKLIIGHEIQNFDLGMHVGIFLALFACAAVTGGAVVDMMQKGMKFPGAQNLGGPGGAAPPPPPPPPPGE